MMTFGMLYWLAPRLWGRKELYSRDWATTHFWMATIGIVLYIVSMWVAGITEGLMWRAVDENGFLQYPNFLDTVLVLRPYYWMRVTGGALYFLGVLLMTWNVFKTITGQPALAEPAAQAAK